MSKNFGLAFLICVIVSYVILVVMTKAFEYNDNKSNEGLHGKARDAYASGVLDGIELAIRGNK